MIALLFCFVAAALSLKGELLYVWNGHPINDFLATVDNDQTSKTYGQVLAKAYLPTEDPMITPYGNQAHHIALSADGNWVIAGGWLSFSLGTNEIFVFQKNKAGQMAFAYAVDLPGGCPDDFHRVGDYAFVISMMCSDTGYAPGHLVYFDIKTKEQKIWEKMPVGSKDKFVDFNPHGGDWDKTLGLIVSDFVLPVSLFTKNFVYRDTIRLFGPDGTQKAVYKMPDASGGGYIATKWIGNGFAIAAASASHNEMYLVDTTTGKITTAIKLSTVNGGAARFSAGIPLVNIAMKKGFISYGLRYLVLFSWDDSMNFSVLQSFDFCDKTKGFNCATEPNPGTHYLALSSGGTRITVSNSFLDAGRVHYAGSKEVHAFKIAADWKSFSYDLLYDQQVSKGRRGAPHGIISWAP